MSVCVTVFFVGLSTSSFAQSNPGNTNIGTRNDSASCDSTCMAQSQQSSQESNLQQRIIPCVSGFSGTRLQTRVKLANGTWGPWTDKNIDNCNCSPTSKTETVVCQTPLKGTYIQRSNWTCTTPKSGIWGDWFTETNNCYTPCAAPAPETRTVSCPTNYSGTETQTRTASCPADDRQAPVWSNWTTVSSNCTYNPPSSGGGGGCPYKTVTDAATAAAIKSAYPACTVWCGSDGCSVY